MIVHAPIAIDSVASIPWKNGGGTTRQLASVPADATASDFLWRVSLARIDSPGEFSAFPGIDRTILLWRGDGVMLRSPAWPDHPLNDLRAPFNFRGEEEVVCDLLGGPTQDLNLMVRRGFVDATFEVINEARYAIRACDDFLLLCASGAAKFSAAFDKRTYTVGANEFLRASQVAEGGAVVIPDDGAQLIAITVRALG